MTIYNTPEKKIPAQTFCSRPHWNKQGGLRYSEGK